MLYIFLKGEICGSRASCSSVGIISAGTIPTEAALNEILLSDGDLEQFLDENISRGDTKA